jgi:hypothetical protein
MLSRSLLDVTAAAAGGRCRLCVTAVTAAAANQHAGQVLLAWHVNGGVAVKEVGGLEVQLVDLDRPVESESASLITNLSLM